MLYPRWEQIAREHAGRLALHDLRTGRRWTFDELAQSAEKATSFPDDVCFPRGNGPTFILDVLSAWRSGTVVCPIEQTQTTLQITPPDKHIAHLKTTSATTGAARLVAFTEEQLAADAQNIVTTMGLRPDSPNLGVISLAHSYGFSNLITPLLLHGIPLILADSLPAAVRKAEALADLLTLPAVPALWRAWHEADAIPRNVRLAISAGAPFPLELERELFRKRGLKVHNFYGSTECGGIAYDRSDSPRDDAACTGEPLDNVSLSVGIDGCLEVRGAAVGEGYWPEAASNLSERRYRTSDLAELLDGKVFLRGRVSDQINIAGRKLSPEIIEQALALHPEVKESLVFGAPSLDEQRSEIIVACVVSRTGITAEKLRNFLLERLPAWQVPREWRFIESLAPNERGKLSRAQWRARLGFGPRKAG